MTDKKTKKYLESLAEGQKRTNQAVGELLKKMQADLPERRLRDGND